MALVYRNGRPYLYKTEREGGRCACRYMGSGEVAILCARMEAIEREGREVDARKDGARLERLDAVEKRVAGLSVVVDALVEAALAAAGWHRPGRHNWRKRRHPMSESTPTLPAAKAPATIEPPAPTGKELEALIQRAQSGDKSAMPALNALLDGPKSRFRYDDVATDAEKAVVRSAYPNDPLSQEVMRRQIGSTVAELAGPNPTPIERMLAQRAALCWVSVNFAETMYANLLKEGTSISRSDHAQRRIDRAHRRLLSSLKTLAAVRRVPLTAVQLNVQSLNVGGS